MDISQATGGSAQHLPSSSQGKDGVVSPHVARNHEATEPDAAETVAAELQDVVEVSSEGAIAADALDPSVRLDMQAILSLHVVGDEERKKEAQRRAA